MLIEHQKKVDPEMAYRFYIYGANIAELHRKQNPKEKPPLVYCFVLYQGKTGQKWNVVKSLHEYLDVPESLKKYIPNFEYEVLDLQSSDLNHR